MKYIKNARFVMPDRVVEGAALAYDDKIAGFVAAAVLAAEEAAFASEDLAAMELLLAGFSGSLAGVALKNLAASAESITMCPPSIAGARESSTVWPWLVA